MKVDIKKVETYDEEEAILRVVDITEDLQKAIDILQNNARVIPVIQKGVTVMCKMDNIYYAESVDKRTYIYTKSACYETKLRLYELEKILNENFMRCSKAMIINFRKINKVKAELNGRMMATLLNDEHVIITRKYVKILKERLGI